MGVFRCDDDRYGGIVFGAFDGIRDWHVNAFITADDVVEQELVSAHEERHLRLQQGTPYGAALAILGAASRAGEYPMEDWVARVDACRTTHETYATFMSVAHVEDGLEVLTGNLRYLEYWRTGQVLYGAFEAMGAPLAVMEYLFHQLMSAVPAEGASGHLGPASAVVMCQTPDDRLDRLIALVRDERSFVDAVTGAVTVDLTVEENLDRLADVLADAGLPTMTAASQDQVSRRMQEAFNAGTSVHRATLTVRSRATSLEDQLDYLARETVRLHDDRLPLTIGQEEFPAGRHPFSVLKRDDEQVGPHLWTVMLSGETLQRQFDTVIDDALYFGFLSCDRRPPSGRAFFLPVSAAPDRVTRDLAEVGLRTLMMTTLSSLARVVRETAFSDTEPLFVLVDEPVRPFLLGLRDSGTVLWATVSVTGDRLLHALILTVYDDSPLHFVWIGTIYTFKPVLEWLRRHDGTFTFAGADYPDVHAELFVILRHTVGSFAVLTSFR